jgi:opacity protein-like surface antigen
MSDMKRVLATAALAAALLATCPSPARADLTGFFGFSPTPSTRSTRGFAVGINLLVVGFEFEYANTAEDERQAAPRLTTRMVNGLLLTPSGSTQLYLTGGAGLYTETYRGFKDTSLATAVGGGLKIGLAGPLRLRLDYRVFHLHGDALYKNPQRFYTGVSIAF